MNKFIISLFPLFTLLNVCFTQENGSSLPSDKRKTTLKGDTLLIQDNIFIGRNTHNFSTKKYHYLNGYFTHLSFGGYLSETPIIYISGDYTKRLRPGLAVGMGLRLSQIVTSDAHVTFSFITPQLFIRKYISKISSPARIYLTANGGYSLRAEKPRGALLAYSGGVTAIGAIGLQWASRTKTKLSIELGYLYQPTEATFPVEMDGGPDGRLIEKRTIWRNVLTLSVDIN